MEYYMMLYKVLVFCLLQLKSLTDQASFFNQHTGVSVFTWSPLTDQ